MKSIFFITFSFLNLISFGQKAVSVSTTQAGSYATTFAGQLAKQDSLNWYLPEKYGAVGDGVTDDAPAFNAMMAAMPAGSNISLSAKTYALNSTWFITKAVKIIGTGIQSRFVCGVNNIGMIHVSVDYVIMRDFFIYNTNSPISGYAIRIDSSAAHPTPIAKFTMDNIAINQFYNSVEAINSYGWTITNCQISFVNYGVKVSSDFVDAGDSHISGCTFAPRTGFTGNTAIYQTNSGGLRIVNNKFNYNSTTKYQYAYYGSPMTGTGDLIIVGNSFENCTKSAIFLSVSPANTFVNTVISGNQFSNLTAGTRPDIQIEGTKAISIQGNIFTKTTGCDTSILLTEVSYTNIHNAYDSYGVPVYYAGTNTNIYGDGAVSKYSVPSYSTKGLLISGSLKDSTGVASIITQSMVGSVPSNYIDNSAGVSQISFASNLTSNVAGVDAALINSNIGLPGGFLFAQQTSSSAVSHLMRIKANGNVGIGTINPANNAILELSSTSKGLLLPRMTSTQGSAITSPENGLLIYVTDTNGTFTSIGAWCRENGTWIKL